jgi:hypothetical protein
MGFSVERLSDEPVVIVTASDNIRSDIEDSKAISFHISHLFHQERGPIYRINDIRLVNWDIDALHKFVCDDEVNAEFPAPSQIHHLVVCRQELIDQINDNGQKQIPGLRLYHTLQDAFTFIYNEFVMRGIL